MGPAMGFQVVVLAGGLSKKLYPLVSKDVPKALLPVGNKPVLSYVLELLEASNLKDIIVVVSGEDAALCIGNWVTEAVHDRLRVEVFFLPSFHIAEVYKSMFIQFQLVYVEFVNFMWPLQAGFTECS